MNTAVSAAWEVMWKSALILLIASAGWIHADVLDRQKEESGEATIIDQ